MEILLLLVSTPWISFVILGLATYRVTRLLTRDEILSPLRNKFFTKFPPERSKLGYLGTCEWCMSFWVASLLVLCFMINVVTVIVMLPLALSAIAGLLTAYEDK
jgi:hypothetical protein